MKSLIKPVPSALLMLAILARPLPAQSLLGEDTERLVVEAVEAAVELDLYNARCRSDVSGRRSDNLNKELVGKFRLTVLKVQDDFFPDGSYRKAQERMQREFLAKLKEAGGCKAAKAAGMAEALRRRYRDLLEEIDALP